MEEIPLGSLYLALLVLILLSGFFSSSETGLMAINKYRLRHLANKGHRGAKLAQKLLRKPDRLFVLVQLAFALCCAFAWDDLRRRMSTPAARRAWWGAVAVISLELSPAPLGTYEFAVSSYLDELAGDATIESLADLPFHGGKTAYDARMSYDQTIHGKAIAGGYVTNLARRDAHHQATQDHQNHLQDRQKHP